MVPSPILSEISKIKEQARPFIKKDWGSHHLYDYTLGLGRSRKIIYITAEVRPDSLDKGKLLYLIVYSIKEIDPIDLGRRVALQNGVSGDQPAYYIEKQLGGDENPRNVFAMNKQLDISAWKADEQRVYDYLIKKRDSAHAHLQYGIEYSKEHSDELCRPSKIYYYFELYDESGELFGQPIEGVFENISPKYTKPDYYRDQFGCTYNLSTKPKQYS